MVLFDGLLLIDARTYAFQRATEACRSSGFAVLAGCLSVPPIRVRAAGDDVLPFKATERTLANGLRVIVVPTGFPNLVAIDIPCRSDRATRSRRGVRGSRTSSST